MNDGSSPDLFREAMAHWASSVVLCATRTDGRIIATTVSSFSPVSASPPTVLVSLSPNAQVLPFIDEGGALGISVLGERQSRWASVFADSFPVDQPDWHGAAPVVADCCIGLECTVRAVHPTDGGSRVVVSRIDAIHQGAERPLLYHMRRYTGLKRSEP